MESVFQNCVSEFDLDLFYQATSSHQTAPPVTPCPAAKKHGLARIKNQVKNTNLVIYKAKGIGAHLQLAQKELEETRKELEDTKNLFFQKNEDLINICDERNKLYNQKMEYSNELKALKEQLKSFEDSDYEAKLKERVIRGYSDQVQGLQKEVENIEAAKKLSERESSLALARANKDKYWAEKKLVKVLNYICPIIKTPDRWLQTLIKKYLPNKKCSSNDLEISEHTSDEPFDNAPTSPLVLGQNEDDYGKVQKPSDVAASLDPNFKVNEVIIDYMETPINSSLLNRNTSLDFDFVGSVDTGRGSSLAFSDGEKSFHSPDYYMNDSPLSTVPNLCNKCNVTKSDASTSPIHETTSSAANSYSLYQSKRDVCTSPTPLETRDVAVDTADILNIECTLRLKSNGSTSPVQQYDKNVICHKTISSNSNVDRIEKPANTAENKESELNCISISNKKSPTMSVKLPDNTTSDSDDSVNNNYRIAGPVENLTTIQSVLYEKPETDINISYKEKLQGDIKSNTEILNNVERIAITVEDLTSIQADHYEKTATNNTKIFNKESPTNPVKLSDNITSTDEVFNNVNRIAGRNEDMSPTTPLKLRDNIPYTDEVFNVNRADGKNDDILSPTTPVKLRDNIPFTDEDLDNINRIAGRNEDMSPTTPVKLRDNTSSTDEVLNNVNIIASGNEYLPTTDEDLDKINRIAGRNEDILSPTTPVKLRDNIPSIDEVLNNGNQIVGRNKDILSPTTPVKLRDTTSSTDEVLNNVNIIASGNEYLLSPTTPVKLRDNIPSTDEVHNNVNRIAGRNEDILSPTDPVKLRDHIPSTDAVLNNINRIAGRNEDILSSTTQVKLRHNIPSIDEVLNNNNRIVGRNKEILSFTTPVKLRENTSCTDEVLNKVNIIASGNQYLLSPTTPVKPRDKIPSTDEVHNNVNSIAGRNEDILSPTAPVKLRDHIPSTDAVLNNINRIAGRNEATKVKLQHNIPSIDEVLNYSNRIVGRNNIPSIDEVLNYSNRIVGRNKDILSPTTPVKQRGDNVPSIDEVLNNGYRVAGRNEGLATIPAVDYGEAAQNDIRSSNKKLSAENKHNVKSNTELNIYRSTVHEKECLDLNNSNNLSNDISTDNEIQTICSKMQLRLQFITPIPPTPPRKRMRSPKLICNEISQRSHRKNKKLNLDKSLNRFKNLFKEMLNNFDFSREEFESMPETYSNDVHNQALIRNLISYSKNGNSTDIKLSTQANNNQDRALDDGVDMPQNNERESEDLDRIPSTERSNNEKEGKICKINKEIPNTLEKTVVNVSRNKETESDSGASLNSKSLNKSTDSIQYGPNTQKYTQQIFPNNNDFESCSNRSTDTLNLSTNSTHSTTEKSNHLDKDYEANTSDDGTAIPQQTNPLKDLDHIREINSCKNLTPNKEPTKIKKTRIISKLEKRRLQLMPKCKIKENLKPTKKVRPKPTPIITVPKKMITESDTVATLNDKLVYENAVKAMAARKSSISCYQEPVVIVEDYIVKMRHDQQKNTTNGMNEKEGVNNLKSHLAKDSLSEIKNKNNVLQFGNLTGASKNRQDAREQPKQIFTEKLEPVACKKKRSSDSNESMLCNEIQIRKRKRVSICDHQSLNENVKDMNVGKTASVACQRLLRSSKSVESDSETLSTIRNGLLGNSSPKESVPYCTTNKTKPKRSISDSQNPCQKSCKSNMLIDDHARTGNKEDSGYEKTRIKKRSTSTGQSEEERIDSTIETEEFVNKKVVKTRRVAKRQNSDNKSDNSIGEKRNKTIHEESDGPVSPQRILRSSNVRHNEDNGLKAAPVFTVTNTQCNSEGHGSKETTDQLLKSQQNDNSVLASPIIKPRRANISSNMAQSSESTNIELCNSFVPESVFHKNHESAISYADLGMFTNEETCEQNTITRKQHNKTEEPVNFNKNNILCRMIEKYGVHRIKSAKKVPDSQINEMCDKLEISISHIIELPYEECQGAMNKLVAEIRSWKTKYFLVGLLKFLKDSPRISDHLKNIQQRAPHMTKQEQVLLYVIDELKNSFSYKGIVKKILINIEYVLFALNKTPEWNVLENLSHFYALLCRYYQKMSQLRLFMVDAMYCLQYKSIILVKQCLDAWMFILPLGHMGLAKTSLVNCLIYLLHFYKCDDESKQVSELRNILRVKYNYDLKDCNDTKMLEVFRTAITEIREDPLERKTLRLSLIILAKRYGAKWCYNHIVKKMIQPLISSKSTSDVAKRFCVSVLGALLKPFPNDMKVHCEIITDYLLEMLDNEQSPKMQEAIITSLICLNRYHNRVLQFLLKWNPHQISPEFGGLFIDYVRSKPVKMWKTKLSQIL